jgi:NAD(P)H-hydrate repair Nnr-like enzyme with NAD(P)H-hydrate epimerase domain
MKNLKFYIDPNKTDAAAAESIAQVMSGERLSGAKYQICVGPAANTTRTLFAAQELAALERREAELAAVERQKRDQEEDLARRARAREGSPEQETAPRA